MAVAELKPCEHQGEAQGRRRVTFCHKDNVLPLSDGLFLATARAVADDYPFLEF